MFGKDTSSARAQRIYNPETVSYNKINGTVYNFKTAIGKQCVRSCVFIEIWTDNDLKVKTRSDSPL